MQKIVSIFFLVICLSSCDDGDLQIETLDFDDTSIMVCDDSPVEANMANILFKVNDTEALILELPADAILNEVTTTDIETSISASGPAKLTYRTFSDKISKEYFCSEIPLTEPIVIEEIIAEGGTVFIETTLNSDSSNYEHTIRLGAITLFTKDNNQITDLSINNFGTVATPVPVEEEEEQAAQLF